MNNSAQTKVKKDSLDLLAFLRSAALIIAVLFLVVYMLTVVTGSAEFFTGSAEGNALIEFADDLRRAETLTGAHYDVLYEIAKKLEYAESAGAVSGVMQSYIGDERFASLFYSSQGTLLNADGTLHKEEETGYPQIMKLVSDKKQGCSEIYRDYSGYDCIAFFVPVLGTLHADGIISVVPAREIFDLGNALGDYTSAALLVDRNGRILSSKQSELFTAQIPNDLIEFVAGIANDNAQITALNEAISLTEGSTALPLTGENARYTVAFAPISMLGSQYLLMTLTDSEALITEENVYIRHIITLVVIAMAAIAVGAFYAIAYYRRMKAALDEATYIDPVVGCPNLKQFKSVAGKMITESPKQFAVCVIELRGYRTLSEDLGTNEAVEFLRHIANTLESYCLPHECYGYFGDGRFLQLLVYNGEASIRDRMRLIETMTVKHPSIANTKNQKPFNVGVGVSGTEIRGRSAEVLIEQAAVACDNAANHISAFYEIYTSEVGAERERNEHIEAEMESALENGAFRLFLQPKYNITDDCIDSAEGLVRWFDPRTGDFRFPGEFLGLFETNGFITKLDHFMYIEMLKMMASSAARGDKIVPMSLNVSAVTLNTSDFLNFYINNKKNYGVEDGLITLEFPENSISDDFGRFREIVDKLHKNGILCSVDDFGKGSGSLGIIKHIPLDELKISRIFMRPGLDERGDEIILRSLVSLAKSFGMKVVQEGVETKEMCDRAASFGCDAIQGYYYAKAISAEEYRLFMNSNTSIKYKSLVK